MSENRLETDSELRLFLMERFDIAQDEAQTVLDAFREAGYHISKTEPTPVIAVVHQWMQNETDAVCSHKLRRMLSEAGYKL